MRSFIAKILCSFGFHQWEYTRVIIEGKQLKICRHCHLEDV